jgi:hypothetical protein
VIEEVPNFKAFKDGYLYSGIQMTHWKVIQMPNNLSYTKIKVDGKWCNISSFAPTMINCQKKTEVHTCGKNLQIDTQSCRLAIWIHLSYREWGTLLRFLRDLVVLYISGTQRPMKTFEISSEEGTSLWAIIGRLWSLFLFCRFLFATPCRSDFGYHPHLLLYLRINS